MSRDEHYCRACVGRCELISAAYNEREASSDVLSRPLVADERCEVSVTGRHRIDHPYCKDCGLVLDASKCIFPAAGSIEQSEAFIAYNQATEDAKEAVRGENIEDYAAACCITAIARKCSPHVYVNRLATGSTSEQCCVTCAEFPMHGCEEPHRCVLDEGHPFDPMYGEIHRFVTHMMPVQPRVARTTSEQGEADYMPCPNPDCIEGKVSVGCAIDKPLISVDCAICKGSGRIAATTSAAEGGERRFETKLLGFAEDERINLCEECLRAATEHNLVIFSSALPLAPPATDTESPRVLHCSCGAACTAEEYEAHRAMGHDTPATAAHKAAQEIWKQLDRTWRVDDLAEIIHRHFPEPVPVGVEAGDLISRKAAIEIAEARLNDVPDTVDLEADRSLFAAGYLAAAGSIKAGLERAPTASAEPDEVHRLAGELAYANATCKTLNANILRLRDDLTEARTKAIDECISVLERGADGDSDIWVVADAVVALQALKET